MKTETLSILLYPYCAGPLALEEAVADGPGEIASGILACQCSQFPVLGGIPIFKRDGRVDLMQQTVDAPQTRGPELRLLLDLIRAGAAEDALLLLLTPPPPSIRRGLDLVERLGRRWQGRPGSSTAPGSARPASWRRSFSEAAGSMATA